MGPFSYETSFLFCVPYLGLLLSPVVFRPVSDSFSFPAGISPPFTAALSLSLRRKAACRRNHHRNHTGDERRRGDEGVAAPSLPLRLSLAQFVGRARAREGHRGSAASERARPCACTSCSLLLFCLLPRERGLSERDEVESSVFILTSPSQGKSKFNHFDLKMSVFV